MNKIKPLTPLLIAVLLLLAGCAPFTTEPSTFTFEGILWKVSSVELADELSWPPMKSETPEVFLKIEFEILDQSKITSTSQKEALREAFGAIVHKATGRNPDQFFTHIDELGGPVDYMTCVFTYVPKETTSAELILPDSQIIKITVRR